MLILAGSSLNDYYPFGMVMPGRQHKSGYRYGFNGKEKDVDLQSTTAYDYGFRIYNSSLGKFLSVDPLSQKYPWYSPYQFAGSMPIWAVDLDGAEPLGYSDYASSFRKGYSWLYKSDEKKVYANRMGGHRLYKFDVVGVGGDAYEVIRKETDYIGFANRLSTKFEYFYLDQRLDNPGGVGLYRVHNDDGSIETKGVLVPFETREQIDTRIGKESTNLILGAFGAAAVTPFVSPYLIATSGVSLATRGVSVGIDYTAQAVGNYLGGKEGLSIFTDINLTSSITSFLNPGSTWKQLIANNLVSSSFSFSTEKLEYTGIGSGGKELNTALIQAAVGALAGRLTRNLDLGIDRLKIRLDHVSQLYGNSHPLSPSLQSLIRNFQMRAAGVSISTGAPGNAINSSMERN